jgi:hypothetical protein
MTEIDATKAVDLIRRLARTALPGDTNEAGECIPVEADGWALETYDCFTEEARAIVPDRPAGWRSREEIDFVPETINRESAS